jgi:hypothetical protein
MTPLDQKHETRHLSRSAGKCEILFYAACLTAASLSFINPSHPAEVGDRVQFIAEGPQTPPTTVDERGSGRLWEVV